MDESTRQALRALPAVEELLNHPAAAPLLARYPRTRWWRPSGRRWRRRGEDHGGGAARGAGAARRRRDAARRARPPEDLLRRRGRAARRLAAPGLRPVLNLTGVVIHTNLGRSPLSEPPSSRWRRWPAPTATWNTTWRPAPRGHRETHIEALLTRLTGAEAAFAVNNNAAAVLLLLMALAPGREVLVSRGQLVEIGGSFRLPDIMRAGGVRLVEVGTTNRTRIDDYEAAITPETAMLLRVHTSNYRIMGFTEEAELGEMVELGRRRGVLGGRRPGQRRPARTGRLPGRAHRGGFAAGRRGRGLLQRGQAAGRSAGGHPLGRREIVDRLRKHPVARALRLDKMTLAALEATLRAYQDPERARREIPALRSLTRTPAETAALAAALRPPSTGAAPTGSSSRWRSRAPGPAAAPCRWPKCRRMRCASASRRRLPGVPGGTARPPGGGPGGSADGPTAAPSAVVALESALRRAPMPVMARVSQDSLHLDVLALDERDLEAVADSVAWAIAQVVAGGRRLRTAGAQPRRARPRRARRRIGQPRRRPLTLGTAGHIDHGKTTLVKALTGRDTDRLKEEKERGISIELGFAELALPSGRHLSVVDVPGHERFVKTMVAGATGIDLFLLVVAADDGVMPQTREHLRIIELLGHPARGGGPDQDGHGRPRAGRAGPGRRRGVARPPRATRTRRWCMVSGVTGRGPARAARRTRPAGRAGAGPPRLSRHPDARRPGLLPEGHRHGGHRHAVVGDAQRRGHGGHPAARGRPEARPALREVRVRSIQVHDQEVDVAAGGQRVALNLTGVDRDEIDRGQWVVKDPAIEPTYLADVRLTLLSDAPGPLPRVSAPGWITAPPRSWRKWCWPTGRPLAPGESCYAQFRFEEQVLVYPGDQFIVRSVTPVTTIGGGRVIDPAPHKHGTGPQWHDRLALLEQGAAGRYRRALAGRMRSRLP